MPIRNRWAIVFSLLLIGSFTFVLLDTFISDGDGALIYFLLQLLIPEISKADIINKRGRYKCQEN